LRRYSGVEGRLKAETLSGQGQPPARKNVEQLDNSLDALKKLQFTDSELKEIDRYAQEGAIDLWRNAREGVQ